MVICKYFLNGNCRFGTKCVNEHLDVKQLLKSDVESAVNGNQWPLSCFGPFKEKPSIPNFIEDQSFEEIRMLCYGSKKQNFFESFNQQFTKEVIEAKNKMKMLLSLNKEVVDIVLNLYNSSEPAKGTTQPSSNPFGIAAAANTQNSNLFGSPAQTPGGIFGGTTGSPFGGNNNTVPTSNIFGGAQKSILGQSAFESFSTQPQQQQQGNGIFGAVQTQQQQQQQTQQPNTFGGNIFAQAAQQTPVGGGSIFSGAQQQQQLQPPSFGGANTSIFSQTPSPGNIFAQAAQQTQSQTPVGGNIFAQQTQQPQVPGFGMFSQPALPAPPAFAPQTTQQSPFGAAQPQQQLGFFGQTQQQQQMDQQKQNAGNPFASQLPSQAQFKPQQCFNASTFNSPFAPAQPQQQQQPNIFAQAAAAGYPQQQQQQQQKPTTSDRTYSKMENLTPEEIEAFKADTFELGKIPFSPPPRELVN